MLKEYLKMKPIVFVLFLIITMSVRVLGQSNYVEGYLINLQNDTIKGLINDQNWEKNPRVISFKTTLSEAAVKYLPTDIAGFYSKSSNEHYKSYVGKVDDSVDESGKLISVTNDAAFFQNDYSKTDTIFLRTIVKGVLSLYQYTDKKGRVHFFAEKEGNPVVELVNQQYLIEQPKGYVSMSLVQLIRKNEVYRKQLMAMLADCDNTNEKIRTTEYTKKSLQKLAASYYACIHKQASFTHKSEGSKFEFGILAGGSVSSLEVKSSVGNTDYGTSVNPVGGIAFNFVLPRNRESWSFYVDVMWRHFSFNNNRVTLIDTVPLYIKSSYLKFDLLVRYTLPTHSQKIRPFVNAGWANNLQLGSNQNVFRYFAGGSGYVYETRKREQGLLLGLGVRTKKLQFEIRNERGNGMSPLQSVASPVRNWYLLLSYWIK